MRQALLFLLRNEPERKAGMDAVARQEALGRVDTMPINRLFRDGKIKPEDVFS
jgi:hypothetical protein